MTQLINISNELYERLSKIKGSRSFTLVIEEMLNKESNASKVMEFAGMLNEEEGKSFDEHIKNMKNGWKKWKIPECV